MYTVTALGWRADGSRLAVGSLCGSVDVYDACVKRTRCDRAKYAVLGESTDECQQLGGHPKLKVYVVVPFFSCSLSVSRRFGNPARGLINTKARVARAQHAVRCLVT